MVVAVVSKRDCSNPQEDQVEDEASRHEALARQLRNSFETAVGTFEENGTLGTDTWPLTGGY